MMNLILVALTIVVTSFNAFAETNYKAISKTTKIVDIQAFETDMNSQNCVITESALYDQWDSDPAYGFHCVMDVKAAAAPLQEKGYRFGDLRTRYTGGSFRVGGVSASAMGLDFEMEKMRVRILVKQSTVSSLQEARQTVDRLMASGHLKLRMSFAKKTCTRNEVDFSNDSMLCDF